MMWYITFLVSFIKHKWDWLCYRRLRFECEEHLIVWHIQPGKSRKAQPIIETKGEVVWWVDVSFWPCHLSLYMLPGCIYIVLLQTSKWYFKLSISRLLFIVHIILIMLHLSANFCSRTLRMINDFNFVCSTHIG